MCNQSVGLIQRAIEYAGITTVSISLLREITGKIRPPRALFVGRSTEYREAMLTPSKHDHDVLHLPGP